MKYGECFQDAIFSEIFKTQVRDTTLRTMFEFHCVLLPQTTQVFQNVARVESNSSSENCAQHLKYVPTSTGLFL